MLKVAGMGSKGRVLGKEAMASMQSCFRKGDMPELG